MTKEIVEALLSDHINGLGNRNFGASTKFSKRSIIRGIKVRTGEIEKERPLLLLTDVEQYNVSLLSNHLVAAPIHTRPYNDYSIPILLNFYGDNENRISFVDPILEVEVLFFDNFPKAVTKTQTCPDSIFDLVMNVKTLVLEGKHMDAKDLIKSYRLMFMKEHGIVSIGYILTKEKMKHLDIDGRERITPPTIQGWEVLFYKASEYYKEEENTETVIPHIEEEEIPTEEIQKERAVDFYQSEINDALEKALKENPLEEESNDNTKEVVAPIPDSDSSKNVSLLRDKVKEEISKGNSPKSPKTSKRDKKTKKSKYAKKGFSSANMSDEELINFMTAIESATKPSEAKIALFGYESLSSSGFRRRYESVCKEMGKRNLADMIIAWDFSDPSFKNHWKHKASNLEENKN